MVSEAGLLISVNLIKGTLKYTHCTSLKDYEMFHGV